MKKVFAKILLFVLGVVLVLSPFLGIFIYGNNTPNVYNKTYYAALVDKYNRLESLKNKKKIVFIGASGVAFGFNSETIMKYYPDYEVQNFGLYADLGIKLMLDLSVDKINKDDIVVIAPELSSQSMSLFFNPVSFLKASEDRKSMFFDLDYDNKKSVICSYLDYLSQKTKMNPNIELIGVYQRKNLNEYGDISYYEDKDSEMVSMRTSNIMPTKYDPNTPVVLSKDIINADFISYINRYASKIVGKGATVLFDYAPINNLSISFSQEEAIAFADYLSSSLHIPVIGNIKDHIIPYEYFYDSNFHMNDTGAIYNSLLFVRDIKTFFGDSSKVEDYPEQPKKAGNIYDETEEDVENSKYFLFEESQSGYILSGLSDEGKNRSELRVPGFYKGERVVRLRPFETSNQIEDIIIPEMQTLIDDGFFASFKNIKTIHILEKNPNNISIAFNLLKDTNPVTIYVPKKSFDSYANDYYWSIYSGCMEGE